MKRIYKTHGSLQLHGASATRQEGPGGKGAATLLVAAKGAARPAAPVPLWRGRAGTTLSTWRPGQDVGGPDPATGSSRGAAGNAPPHTPTPPPARRREPWGRPPCGERSRGSGEPPAPRAAPAPLGALGVTERMPRPRRRAPTAALARRRPAAPEELGARGGAQHGVAVVGPRLGPAAAQVPPGRGGGGCGAGGRGGAADGPRLSPAD